MPTPNPLPAVLEKIQKLMDLAVRAGTSDEARNAALQAVKLIQKHGLQVVQAVAEDLDSDRHPVTPSPRHPSSIDAERLKRAAARGAGRVAGQVVEDVIGEFFRGKGRGR